MPTTIPIMLRLINEDPAKQGRRARTSALVHSRVDVFAASREMLGDVSAKVAGHA